MLVMSRDQLLGIVREFIHTNSRESKASLADAFEEAGDEATANILRGGMSLWWAWAMEADAPMQPSWVQEEKGFTSAAERQGMIYALQLMGDSILSCWSTESEKDCKKTILEEYWDGHGVDDGDEYDDDILRGERRSAADLALAGHEFHTPVLGVSGWQFEGDTVHCRVFLEGEEHQPSEMVQFFVEFPPTSSRPVRMWVRG